VLVGDALELLSEQKGPFDIVFNDVDKQDYPRVFKLALPRLRRGGLFVSDNVLWHGRVISPPNPNDSATRAILDFNQLLYSAEELYTTILPLRDGVSVSLKL
jgi:predicted O-methyltransferase YrrM